MSYEEKRETVTVIEEPSDELHEKQIYGDIWRLGMDRWLLAV